MSKLYMTKGLPASGKSYWAEQYQRENPSTKIICKDNLRDMLDTGKWSGGREKFVLKTRNRIAYEALEEGYDVIIADTNLHSSHEQKLKQIAAECEAEFIVKDFTHVDIKTCIKRDQDRERTVGEKVIRDMYNKYLATPQEFDVPRNKEKDPAIIVDIDGTLASSAGIRSPYDGEKCHLDTPNSRLIEIVNTLEEDYYIIICTGREDRWAEKTEEWLAEHGVRYDRFHARKTGDSRKDSIIKKEIYDHYIKEEFDVRLVFDDRPQVIRMWKEEGLLVADVGPQYEF